MCVNIWPTIPRIPEHLPVEKIRIKYKQIQTKYTIFYSSNSVQWPSLEIRIHKLGAVWAICSTTTTKKLLVLQCNIYSVELKIVEPKLNCEPGWNISRLQMILRLGIDISTFNNFTWYSFQMGFISNGNHMDPTFLFRMINCWYIPEENLWNW